jgi:L-alanine-DL-glutamate epimerase-like enolase superfamily enzyme
VKITGVRSFLLSYPFPKPIRLSYYGGEREIVKRDALFIRIETDKGLTGYAPGQASEKAHAAIESTVAPFLTGHSLGDPDALRILFMKGPGLDPEIAKAYCSAEIALYDLLGKAHGVPVSELLGGRVRDRIRVYGSAGMYMPPEGYAEEAALAASLGFTAYKMRPALGPDKDVETVRLMREAAGESIDLMVDAHSWWRMGDDNYSSQTVEEVARGMSEYSIAWLEEPLPPADHAAYRRLKDLNMVALASGEHEPDEEGYLDLIHSQAVDYVQMDIVCQGGYPVARRLFNEIGRAGLRFAFHSWGTALELIAAAHIGICWPELVVEWLEYPCYSTPSHKFMYEFPLAAEILKQPVELANGALVVSDKPGLGVEVNEGVIERYPWVPGPWSFFTMHSPRQTWAVTGDHSIQWAGSRPQA